MKQIRAWLACLAVVGAALGALSIPLSEYSRTASTNNMAVPDGAPENILGGQLNDVMRQMMAVVRTWYDDPEWLELTYDLSPRGAKTLTKISATQIDIIGTDATAYFTAGRRVRMVGATTEEMVVASSAMNGSDTRVTLTTHPQSTAVVPTSPTAIYAYIGKTLRTGAFANAGNTEAGIFTARGTLHARFEYVSATTVRVSRGHYQKILADVAGVLYESASDLSLTFANLDTGAEASSTWYYVYLYDSSGALAGEISATGPQMDPASGVVGYKTGDATRRYVGAFFNNASSNVQPFDFNPKSGRFMFRSVVAAFTKSPGLGIQSTYTTQAFTGNIPSSARTIVIAAEVRADDYAYYYGHESITGTVSTTPTPYKLKTHVDSTNNDASAMAIIEIPVDSTPAIAWGNVDESGDGGSRSDHRLDPVGWIDDLGIVQ